MVVDLTDITVGHIADARRVRAEAADDVEAKGADSASEGAKTLKTVLNGIGTFVTSVAAEEISTETIVALDDIHGIEAAGITEWEGISAVGAGH